MKQIRENIWQVSYSELGEPDSRGYYAIDGLGEVLMDQADLRYIDEMKASEYEPIFYVSRSAALNGGFVVVSRQQRAQMIEVMSEERIRVRYGETDQMGHAYYANYLFWFEQARGKWCRDRGFTYKSLEEMGFFLPVVEAHLRYKGEVKYDDWIIVKITLSEVKRAAMKFEYIVVNESTGAISTEGYTWHVLMGSARKAVSIPANVRELLERNPNDFETLS